MKKTILGTARTAGKAALWGAMIAAAIPLGNSCNQNEDPLTKPLEPNTQSLSAKWNISSPESQWASFEFYQDLTYMATRRAASTQGARMRATAEPAPEVVYGKYVINGREIKMEGLGKIKVDDLTEKDATFTFTPEGESTAETYKAVKTDPDIPAAMDADTALWISTQTLYRIDTIMQDTAVSIRVDTFFYRTQERSKDTTFYRTQQYSKDTTFYRTQQRRVDTFFFRPTTIQQTITEPIYYDEVTGRPDTMATFMIDGVYLCDTLNFCSGSSYRWSEFLQRYEQATDGRGWCNIYYSEWNNSYMFGCSGYSDSAYGSIQMYTRYDTTRMSRDTIYTIVRDTTLRVDTSYMVNTSVRVDTSYTITANVRVDTAYTIVENVRVDTFYWAEGAPVWRTDSTEVTATYTLRFYKNGALNRAEMRQWRSDNEAEVTQYTGGYEFPYEGKTGVISIKFYSQDNPSLPTGIHFHGSVSGRNMILQNDQDSKVQRFVKQ